MQPTSDTLFIYPSGTAVGTQESSRKHNSSWVSWCFPSFRTECPMSWETSQTQAKRDGWSPYTTTVGGSTGHMARSCEGVPTKSPTTRHVSE